MLMGGGSFGPLLCEGIVGSLCRLQSITETIALTHLFHLVCCMDLNLIRGLSFCVFPCDGVGLFLVFVSACRPRRSRTWCW